MKIGLLSDPHYSSAERTCGVRLNSASLKKLERALSFFKAEGCDLIIALGDLTDTEAMHATEAENLRKIARLFDDSSIEAVCLMGNHDAFVFTEIEFFDLIGCERKPRLISRDNVHLLFIDACYFSSGIHYAPGDSDWTDTFCPQLPQLRESLDSLCGNVYVFIHQNLDPQIPENHCLSNAAEVRSVLEQSQKVKVVFQGHYHPGHQSVHNGIRYITLPAMCENDDAAFIVTLSDSSSEITFLLPNA